MLFHSGCIAMKSGESLRQQRQLTPNASRNCQPIERVNAILAKQGGKSMNGRMDNQEVCRQLNISLRTLQILRDNGTLAYSQTNHKVFYKPEDVMRIVKSVERKRADRAV